MPPNTSLIAPVPLPLPPVSTAPPFVPPCPPPPSELFVVGVIGLAKFSFKSFTNVVVFPFGL